MTLPVLVTLFISPAFVPFSIGRDGLGIVTKGALCTVDGCLSMSLLALIVWMIGRCGGSAVLMC